jgi:NADH-quinone oxidoreductase subunit J
MGMMAAVLAAVSPSFLAFGALALVALVTALVVVRHRTPVVQGLFLVLHLLSIAGLFAALDARFLAVLQVLIYAGAVVVLIVFVIMLLNLRPEARGGPGAITVGASIVLAVGLVALLARAVAGFSSAEGVGSQSALVEGFGSPDQVGSALFEIYFYPFEIVSLALVAAMVGAVVLAKRHLEG